MYGVWTEKAIWNRQGGALPEVYINAVIMIPPCCEGQICLGRMPTITFSEKGAIHFRAFTSHYEKSRYLLCAIRGEMR